MYSDQIKDAQALYNMIETEDFSEPQVAKIKIIVSKLLKFSTKFVSKHDFLNLCLLKEKFTLESGR